MHRFNKALAYLAELALVLMVLITFVSVVLRWLLNKSLPDDVLFSAFLMVFVVYAPLAWIQEQKNHLVVTIISDHLPIKWQRLLMIFGDLLGIITMTVLCVSGFQVTLNAYVFGEIEYNSYYNLLTWPIKFIIPVGLALWVLQFAIDLVTNIGMYKKNDPSSTSDTDMRVGLN